MWIEVNFWKPIKCKQNQENFLYLKCYSSDKFKTADMFSQAKKQLEFKHL